MHASSLENMYRCHARYLSAEALLDRNDMLVLDVGGADINGGYREVFADPRFHYQTADLAAGPGIDIVLEDPYRLPFPDNSVDIVLSGRMLERSEFFWLTFSEMVRVLKPDGYLFLIAPSAGPIHSHPVDCYRFHPDAYRALAKHAGCHLLEVWLDERGPWRDLVGVFAKRVPAVLPAETRPVLPVASTGPFPGRPEEEVVSGTMHYLELLATIHDALQPPLYLEIGVRSGASLALAKGPAIGVDPKPEPSVSLPATTRLLRLASDDFFRDVAAQEMPDAPDFAFIDGMHWFEYALRDFMHIERLAKVGTLVVIDDIYPSHPAQAERNRRTRVWTGDIWKLHACLVELRPDLVLLPIDTAPTGLLLVAGLDPHNRVLWESYNAIVGSNRGEQVPPAAVLRRTGAIPASDPRVAEVLSMLIRARNAGTARDVLRTELQLAAAGSARA